MNNLIIRFGKLLPLFLLIIFVLGSPLAITENGPALDDLAGRYSMSSSTLDNLELVISNEGDMLLFRTNDGPIKELVRVSGLKFYVRGRDGISFEFVTDYDGLINTFVVRAGAQTEEYTRVEILARQRESLRDVSRANQRASGYREPTDREDGLVTMDLDQVGARAPYLYKLLENIKQGAYGRIDSLLVTKDGRLVVEQYFNAGNVDRAHQMQSVSKSVTSLLVGAAIHEGHIESVKDSVINYLPDYKSLLGGGREAITIEDLLTMSAGLEWDEHTTPYTDPNNIRAQELASPDSVAFTLNRPLVNEPGEAFTYSGGYVTVMGEIIKNATGAESVFDYLQTGSLGKLGFIDPLWLTQHDGRSNTAGGLLIGSRDLAKLGLLVLMDGVWQGERLLPEGWITASTANHISPQSSEWNEYGYYWWGRTYIVDGKEFAADAAQGWGGQELIIIDELGLVVVITATNFTMGSSSHEWLTQYIIPAFAP